ncbi:MAG: PAS domain-containing hybrid sensor histidine kinase/response regulator [Syntrophales bacterium]
MADASEATQASPSELESLHREIARLKKSEADYRRTMEALLKSEEYFRAITQNSSDLVIITDQDARITYVNPSVERILGYEPAELIGKSAFAFILPFEVPRAAEEYGKAVQTRNMVIPNAFAVWHKDGSERILEGVGKNLLDDPAVNGFVMNVHDITERAKAEAELEIYRKRLEELVEQRTAELAAINSQLRVELAERRRVEKALRESDERFRALIQTSSDVISIHDQRGRFVYASPSADAMFGYPPGYLIGKTPFLFIHPDDVERISERFADVLSQSTAGKPTEFRFRKSDGSWIPLEAMGNNLLDYTGINGIVITSRDITRRKQKAEEHQQLLERLHRAQKMESLGTLAGGVAHDLNNVLGVLVGYSELLLTEISEESPSRKRVTRILQSSQRAAAIIEDLLTLARRGVKATETVNLSDVVTGYLKTPEFEKLTAYHPHVVFRAECSPHLHNIKGSPVHLAKTVMNLVSNAAEAVPHTGEVVIRTENRHLDTPPTGHDTMQRGDYCVLTVADNGTGISPADMEKIFEPFYTKKVMGRSGTGLGLAVVWGTVQDHRAHIDVQSEDGKGSAFTIYFPATTEAPAEERPSPVPDQYRGAGESILVVDDVQEQREVATSMLGSLGYRVRTCSSGEGAVAFLKTHAVDLLILDMIMDPGIDGLETYERIRKINPLQKALIVSGFSETNRVRKALALGADSYVKKPYTLETIGLAIRKALASAAYDCNGT